MSTSDVIAIVSAVVAFLSLTLAAIQYLDGRRHRQTERERLAAQTERLRTAVAGARLNASAADMIVQRSKDDASMDEIRSVARVLRGNLQVLAQQIDDETRQVAAWHSSGETGTGERRSTPSFDAVEVPTTK